MSMSCIQPGSIEEGDLIALARGDASSSVADHVARCASCAREMESLARAEGILRASLERAECPSIETLLTFQAGLLQPSVARELTRHTAVCELCQEELAELDVPAEPVRAPVWDRLLEGGRRLLHAVLEPFEGGLAPAFRGESDQRRLRYRAGDLELLLALIPPDAPGGRWEMEGQIAPWPPPDASEESATSSATLTSGLTTGDAPPVSDVVDEFGFFTLGQFGPGEYRLELQLPASTVIVENIRIP